MRGVPIRFVRGHGNRVYRRPPISGTEYLIEDHGFTSECWIWRGKPSSKGYGKVTFAGKIQYAHRAMYEQEVGPIPEGLQIDHLCRIPLCVNPGHMEPVTHATNLRRGNGTKITRAQALAIRRDTRVHRVIAADYGLSRSHVSRIRSGVKWSAD